MIVLDASAAVDLILDTPFSNGIALRLLEHAGDVHAPHLLDAEVGQALRRHILTGVLDGERAEEAVADLRDLPISRYPHLRFLTRAIAMAPNLTVYDALYVALAESLEASLVTRDRRLARAAGDLIDVIYIS